jgi:Rod binding domain-containing protein
MISTTPVIPGSHGLSLSRDRAAERSGNAPVQRTPAYDRSPEGKARKAAEDMVSLSLIEPTLKMLRESNNAAAPFAPGDVEKAFGPLLDQAISQRIVRASGFGIVDRLASDLLKHGGAPRGTGVELHA